MYTSCPLAEGQDGYILPLEAPERQRAPPETGAAAGARCAARAGVAGSAGRSRTNGS